MSKLQRFNSFIGGLFTVFFGFALYWAPFMGVDMISAVMTAALLLMGIRSLYFYFTMSRHMVGGKYSLFAGISNGSLKKVFSLNLDRAKS